MTIRPSLSSDVPQVTQLVTSILKKEFSEDQAAYPTDDLERLSEMYAAPDNIFLVAEEDHRIVGTCGVKTDSRKTAILRRLFVDPAHRGKGVGADLLKKALVFCRERGFREVIIRTSNRMEAAVRLCRAQGFQEDGHWTLGNATLVRYHLRLV